MKREGGNDAHCSGQLPRRSTCKVIRPDLDETVLLFPPYNVAILLVMLSDGLFEIKHLGHYCVLLFLVYVC